MARFHLRTLGGLSLHEGSPHEPAVLGASKSLAVLAYLARAPGRAALRSHLSELLWPGLPRKKARRALRQCLYYLTQRAGTELWEADDGRLSLADGKLDVDVWALDRALEEERWADAVEAYRGPFLAGFDGKAGLEFEHWAEAQHERVWAGVKAACHRLVEDALEGESADPARAVRYASRCVDLNPLDERAQEALVRAQLAAGDRVAAFRAYESYRTLLREELGDVPGPELSFRTEEIRAALFGRHPEGARAAAERRTPEVVRVPRKPRGEDGPIWPEQPHHDLRTAAGTGAEGRSPPEPAPTAEDDFPVTWRALAWGLLGAAAVVLVMTLGAGFHRDDARARTADPAASGAVVLMATLVGAPGTRERSDSALDVRVSPSGTVTAQPVFRPHPPSLVSPDGRLATVQLATPDGIDIGLRRGDGPVRDLVSDRPDDWALDWSPDSRYVLYHYSARLRADSLYVSRLGVADAVTGAVRRFPVVAPTRTDSDATWSPVGTAIAFTGSKNGRSDVYVADVDGRHVTDVSRSSAPDRDPAWSPDGRLLAFASKRNGSWDLYVVQPDGGKLEQLTFAPGDETSPAWLSSHEVAYVADQDGERDLWSVDVTTRRVRRLTTVGDLERVAGVRRPDNPALVERVRIQPRFRSVAPGQRIDFRGRALDRAGHAETAAAARLRWTSSDSSVLRIGKDGSAEVRGTGDVTLVASAGAWRADTLRIAARQVAVRDVPVLLAEDWSEGLDSARWTSCGRPLPKVVSGGGPWGHAFLSNGDANFSSGVVSRDSVPLADGLTIEWWASLPFNGHYFQGLGVGLTTGSRPRKDERGTPQSDVVFFGTRENPPTLSIASGGQPHTHGPVPVPSPEHLGDWHLYVLELQTDGSVLYFADGRLRWRSEPGFVAKLPRYAHIVLNGNTLSGRFLLGPVKVWQGLKWALPDVPSEAKLARR